MFITIKDAWKAEKTAHAEKEECIPSVFLLIFGHKRFKHTLNSAEPGLKRNIMHRQNKTHKFSDYPLLNSLCIRHLCCCCSFFIQTQTQRHRKTDESKAIWKNCWPQSRFQATVYKAFSPWTLSSSICSACLCRFLALPVSTFRPAMWMTTMTCNRWWWTNVKSQFFTTNETLLQPPNVLSAFHANAFWENNSSSDV